MPVCGSTGIIRWRTGEAGGREAPPSSAGDFPFVRRRGAIAFVGLTSAVPMPVTGTPAAGRLGPQQIAGLRKTLTALGREGMFRVILIHHSPLPEVSIRKALLDAPDFIDVLADAGAELVLHGHLHQSDFEEIAVPGGAIPVIGVPSASARPYRGRPAARYHIYRLSGRRNAWRLDVVFRVNVDFATYLGPWLLRFTVLNQNILTAGCITPPVKSLSTITLFAVVNYDSINRWRTENRHRWRGTGPRPLVRARSGPRWRW